MTPDSSKHYCHLCDNVTGIYLHTLVKILTFTKFVCAAQNVLIKNERGPSGVDPREKTGSTHTRTASIP